MSQTGLNSLEKRAAVSLAAVFAFRMLGLFMLIPVMAIYGRELQGFSPLWIGLAIGAYGLTQALLQIPMGWLSDRFGRKRIIVIGLVIFALGSIVAATAESIQMVAFGRALQGMGAIASAVLALAADLTRDEQRPKVMAVIGMSIGLSFTVAMFLGPLVAEFSGLSGLFWLIAGLAGVGILVVTLFVPNAVNRAPKGDVLAKPAVMSDLVKDPQLLRLDFGVMFLHLTLTAIFVALPVKLLKEGIAADHHWQVYLPVLLAAFVLMVPMMIIGIKKQLEKNMFVIAVAMLTLSLALMYAFYDHFLVLIAAVMLYFIAFNYLEATMPALLSRFAPAGHKGSAMGMFSTGQFLGAFVGGSLGGWVAANYGLHAVFAAACTVGVIWLLIVFGMTVPPRSKIVTLLSTVDDDAHADQLAEQLVALPGVLEATVVVDENRSYLKVIEQEFDYDAARRIVAVAE